MASLLLSESIVSQDPQTTQWQHILHHKLFCLYACNERSASEYTWNDNFLIAYLWV